MRKSNKLTAKIGEEILSLQRAAVEAGAAHRLVVEPKTINPFDHGQFVLDELTATLQWLFDDGIEDERDEKLANLDAAHDDDPETADALALALDDYAALADSVAGPFTWRGLARDVHSAGAHQSPHRAGACVLTISTCTPHALLKDKESTPRRNGAGAQRMK